jgi:integrase
MELQEVILNLVQPIKSLAKIEEIKKKLSSHPRNYLLFVMGLNTGLRISDMLRLKVEDVRDKTHISLKESKTRKVKKFLINQSLRAELNIYIQDMESSYYLFNSERHTNKAISRSMVHRILKAVSKEVGLTEVSCHSLRKSFGFHFYQKTKDLALLQDLFNHSSPKITMHYIGLNQEYMDEAIKDFSL